MPRTGRTAPGRERGRTRGVPERGGGAAETARHVPAADVDETHVEPREREREGAPRGVTRAGARSPLFLSQDQRDDIITRARARRGSDVTRIARERRFASARRWNFFQTASPAISNCRVVRLCQLYFEILLPPPFSETIRRSLSTESLGLAPSEELALPPRPPSPASPRAARDATMSAHAHAAAPALASALGSSRFVRGERVGRVSSSAGRGLARRSRAAPAPLAPVASIRQQQSSTTVYRKSVDARDSIRMGIPSKGRMAEDTMDLLGDCQLKVRKINPRQYAAEIPNVPGMEVWFQRATDVVRKLISGDIDIGIVATSSPELHATLLETIAKVR